MVRPIYLDTCALKAPVTFMWYAYGSARTGTLTESVSAEMCKLSVSRNLEDREAAARAALTIHKLERLPGVRLIRDRRPPLAEHTDEDLILRAQTTRGRILTADRDFQELARISGVEVIAVQHLWDRFRVIAPEMALVFSAPESQVVSSFRMIARGEVLHIKIIEEGRSPHQGVGYLEDGRKVVVDHGRSYLGMDTDVVVRNVRATSGGELIFAVPTALSNGNGKMGEDL